MSKADFNRRVLTNYLRLRVRRYLDKPSLTIGVMLTATSIVCVCIAVHGRHEGRPIEPAKTAQVPAAIEPPAIVSHQDGPPVEVHLGSSTTFSVAPIVITGSSYTVRHADCGAPMVFPTTASSNTMITIPAGTCAVSTWAAR